MFIREALAQSTADLKKAGIENPSLDASLLLAHILNTNRTSLIASGTDPLPDENCTALLALIKRRIGGECVAYIIGKKEFRGLEFLVNPSVLVPRPDTEILVETALAVIREQRAESSYDSIRVLDLCTGSGAVAIALKNEMPNLEVHATDISAEALQTAKTNAEHLLSGNKIHFYLGDLYNAHSLFTPHSSLLTAHSSLLLSNPPYIPSDDIKSLSAEVQKEPLIALDGGKTGLEIITRIINGAPDYLEHGGYLLLEADPRQMKAIKVLLAQKGFKGIKLYKDLSGQERVIGGKYED